MKKKGMVDESETGSTLTEFIEAEAYNLDLSLKLFGASIAIVEDVDSIYGLLTGYVESLESKLATAYPEAFGCVVLQLATCRTQFKLGIITILRCHWTDSLMYLRRATEACAIAARIHQHPEFAQVWMNAVKDPALYEKFKGSFKKLFPPADKLLQAVFEFYDHASKALHGSPLSLKGHVIMKRSSSTSLDIDFNAFDVKFKDQLAASVFYHLVAHQAILKVLGRTFAKGDAAATKDFETAMGRLDRKLESQRLEWQHRFPEADGW